MAFPNYALATASSHCLFLCFILQPYYNLDLPDTSLVEHATYTGATDL